MNPSNVRIFVATPVLLAGAIVACVLFPGRIDHAMGVVNGSDLLHHLLSVAGMASALLYVASIRNGANGTVPRTLFRLVTAGAAVLGGLIVWQWLQAPVHVIESLGDASEWQTLHGTFGFVTIIFQGFVTAGMARIAWQCIHDGVTDRTGLPEWRTSIVVMGLGQVAATLSQMIIVVRLWTPEGHYQTLTQVHMSVQYAAMAIYSVGLILPVPGAIILRAYQHVRLGPLWTHLTGQYPLTVKPTPRIRSPRALLIATNRRFLEVADCLSQWLMPIDDMDQIVASGRPVNALGRYLATSNAINVSSDGELLDLEPEDEYVPASTALPFVHTVDSERSVLLTLARAFNSSFRVASAQIGDNSYAPPATRT